MNILGKSSRLQLLYHRLSSWQGAKALSPSTLHTRRCGHRIFEGSGTNVEGSSIPSHVSNPQIRAEKQTYNGLDDNDGRLDGAHLSA